MVDPPFLVKLLLLRARVSEERIELLPRLDE
jgi:hypothetical protein